jgi:acetyl esterase/lipase
MRPRHFAASLLLILSLVPAALGAGEAEKPTFKRTQDVIYGRLPGVALTMDVFSPGPDAKVKANGSAVIWVVSGGWMSAHESLDSPFLGAPMHEVFIRPLVDRGYTVFAVVHGSQPKYTITEILPQLNRAVRYIRYHAKEYHIHPDRLGIVGASAGGHLSLMQGMAPQPADEKAKDPVDRVSSRVQAVAAFVPPTDFLNFGGEGVNALGKGPLAWLKAPFDFHELAKSPTAPNQFSYERITDEKRILEIGREISPISHVGPENPPILTINGEVDKLVPVQQAKSLKAKLDAAKVTNEMVIKPGANHVWADMGKDMQLVADWFDKHLAAK